jgi:AcrR family transcriptional regulator
MNGYANSMARTAQPLDPAREEDLLLAAAGHFAAQGFAGTSLNNVITEANWGKSSFYHYFSNKRALHDHVVRTLARRLLEGVQVPEVERLAANQFWAAMADLLDALGRAARRHPETWYLGQMFHAPTSEHDGCLQELREQVENWLRRAIAHGRKVGVVRDDLPEPLVTELTLAVLQTLDRWAVRRKLHSPGGPGTPHVAVRVVRDLIDHR